MSKIISPKNITSELISELFCKFKIKLLIFIFEVLKLYDKFNDKLVILGMEFIVKLSYNKGFLSLIKVLSEFKIS